MGEQAGGVAVSPPPPPPPPPVSPVSPVSPPPNSAPFVSSQLFSVDFLAHAGPVIMKPGSSRSLPSPKAFR
eukprot:scaffold1712_cov82-Phaeocystis_antarctica.AAC.3